MRFKAEFNHRSETACKPYRETHQLSSQSREHSPLLSQTGQPVTGDKIRRGRPGCPGATAPTTFATPSEAWGEESSNKVAALGGRHARVVARTSAAIASPRSRVPALPPMSG